MAVLRVVGGDVALDLVNTVEPRLKGQVPERDHLDSSTALLAWAERVGLIDAPSQEQVSEAWAREPGAAATALEDVQQLRRAVGAAVDAARTHVTNPTTDLALQSVLQRAAAALTRSTLTLDVEGQRPVRRTVGTHPTTLLADRLAVAALDLLQTADLHRLKSCPPEHGGCGWVFLDTSKNGSRRWCSMDDCGTHAKSRRLTQRRRDSRSKVHTPA
jgi:predicted RNA-binding Zn ribbon-like protein